VRRRLIRLALFLFGVFLVIAAAVTWRLWRALPETTGTFRVAGLRTSVEIIRDPEGVPHIRASNEHDALFALGYVHAQDRLWQMDFQRRIASGRLSEILGPATLDTDRMMRTVGFARAAREALGALNAETRASLDAYVAGVNAYRQAHMGSRLPVEFAILRFAPEPWRAEDVLAWQKVMGWSMSTNWREELLRVRLTAKVGAGGAAQLLPDYVRGGPVVLPDFVLPLSRAAERAETQSAETVTASIGVAPSLGASASLGPFAFLGASGSLGASAPSASLLDPPYAPARGGSNNWVLSGTHTRSRKPYLANDPHLATQAPAVWYVAHITGGALDVIGATLPGTPAVVIGHNQRIAWGVTNMMADVQDLFAERIDDRNQSLVDGRWEPMRVLHETITVRNEEPVALRVRITRHGPLISDLFDERTPLALRWTGHDAGDRTSEAFLRINLAQSWRAFVEAFDGYQLPMLNFVYADVDGNIAYVGPGALPIRTGDGRSPQDGTLGANDWRGYVPLDELPRALNPSRGFIASANNQVVANGYPYVLSTSWDAPYRAARITEVLSSTRQATMDDMQRLQTDQHSLQPVRLLPLLLQAWPRSDAARQALAALKRWNRSIAPDSAPAAVYKAYYARAGWRLFADDLGSLLWTDYSGLSGDVAKALDAVAQTAHSPWCDDVNTAKRESCGEILGEALELALEDLRRAQRSSEMDAWRWDRQNDVWFPHLPFQVSNVLRPVFSRHVRRGGDGFTVNPSMPMRDQMLVSSYRQIIDLSNFDQSVFILPLGQSGHLMSGRYADLLRDWNEGRYRPLRFSPASVNAAADTRLLLQPQER
jgi:penicillin amidase